MGWSKIVITKQDPKHKKIKNKIKFGLVCGGKLKSGPSENEGLWKGIIKIFSVNY